jgi:hypothetical protein
VKLYGSRKITFEKICHISSLKKCMELGRYYTFNNAAGSL